MSMQAQTCPACGGTIREDHVHMSLWKGERLIVIEDVPAAVCEQCHEQYYDDFTRYRIERLGENGFPVADAQRVLEVPVFSLDAVPIPQQEPAETDEEASVWQPDWSDFYETG